MMLNSRWFPLAIALLIGATILWSPAFARAQDGEEEIPQPEVPALGTEVFRHKLFEKGLTPIRNSGDIRNNPQRIVIVLLGRRSVQNYLGVEVRNAVANGAALLIATDQSTAGTPLERYFGVNIMGDRVQSDPEACLLGKPADPFVRPFTNWKPIDADSPKHIFDEIKSVGSDALATQVTSVVRINPGNRTGVEPLAGYPFGSKVGKWDYDPNKDLFAVGGPANAGRYLILADHSVFINQMMLCADRNEEPLNNNLRFADNCIDWLKGDSRDRCLFIEDGEIQTAFEIKFPERKDSDLEKILKLLMFLEHNGNGNRIVSKLEDDNFFNNLLGTQVSTREIIRTLLIVLVCLSAFFAFWLTIRNRTSPDPAQALVTPELAAMIPKGDVLRQRFNSLLEVENIYEAARDLIRDFLGGLNAEPDDNSLPPKLVIEDGYEEEIQLRRKLGRLWRIAYAAEPVRVAPDEWKRIKEDLQEILADADDGWWKFVKREQ